MIFVHLCSKEDPCTCNVGNCKIHSKFAFGLKSTAKKSASNSSIDQVKPEETLKRKPSVKKRPDPQNGKASKPSESKNKGDQSRASSVVRSRASSVAPDDEMVEVIKIINFVAIKVTVKASEIEKKRKGEENNSVVMPQSSTTPPEEAIIVNNTSSFEASPPRELTPPPPAPPSPPPPPPPPKSPSPPPSLMESPGKLASPEPEIEIEPTSAKLEIPISPIYQRKFFPNPEPVEPYKPKIRDYTPNTVKLKRTEEEPIEEHKSFKRQFSSDIEVTPIKFSSDKANCVKQALFVGNQYMGEDVNDFKVSNKINSLKSQIVYLIPFSYFSCLF